MTWNECTQTLHKVSTGELLPAEIDGHDLDTVCDYVTETAERDKLRMESLADATLWAWTLSKEAPSEEAKKYLKQASREYQRKGLRLLEIYEAGVMCNLEQQRRKFVNLTP